MAYPFGRISQNIKVNYLSLHLCVVAKANLDAAQQIEGI